MKLYGYNTLPEGKILINRIEKNKNSYSRSNYKGIKLILPTQEEINIKFEHPIIYNLLIPHIQNTQGLKKKILIFDINGKEIFPPCESLAATSRKFNIPVTTLNSYIK